MSPLTLYLGKFFGLSCLVLFAVFAARPKHTLAAITSITASPGLLLITGVFTTFGGLATVLAHNLWSGGALPITVTLLGWLTLIKGVALTAIPPTALTKFYRVLHYPERFGLVAAAGLAFSAWLTYTAFHS